MFKAEHEKQVKESTNSMIAGREQLLSKVPSIKALLLFEGQSKKVAPLGWKLAKINGILKDIEDSLETCW